MTDHKPGCPQLQFWDAGYGECPCTCDHTDDIDIRPRIDSEGVGWCIEDCPSASSVVYDYDYDRHEAHCKIDTSERMCGCDVCPHHARRVAAERDRLRESATILKDIADEATGDFAELVADYTRLRAAIRTALAESTTYDEVEARLVGLVEEG